MNTGVHETFLIVVLFSVSFDKYSGVGFLGQIVILFLVFLRNHHTDFVVAILIYLSSRASLVAQRLKHLPAMWETRVQSLGREDPLEKEMATHSSILAWRIPWTEEPGRLYSTGSQRIGHD